MAKRMEGLVGKLTISRRSDDMIYIQITDESSKSRFVELELTTSNFAMAVTGLSHVECKLSVDRLDAVGKEKQVETRKALCPLNTYDREKLVQWIHQNCWEDGWEIDAYIGSQGSVTRVDDGTLLRYKVFRYIDRVEH